MGIYWVNGVPKKLVSLDIRALHFGDGFFTTAKICNGQINFFNEHINRIIMSARKLMFNNLNLDLLNKEIEQALHSHTMHDVIKIIISRINHNNIYGYSFNKNSESLRIIRTSKLPIYYNKWIKFGIRLKISSIRLARESHFTGIKHLNRLEQVLIANEIHQDDMADEAIVLDTKNNIIECCCANIFWRQKYQVFTPSLRYAGINGIIRQLILKLLPSLGYCIKEIIVGVNHLKKADEVFISNSLLPVVSVNAINDYYYIDKTLCNILKSHIIHKDNEFI